MVGNLRCAGKGRQVGKRRRQPVRDLLVRPFHLGPHQMQRPIALFTIRHPAPHPLRQMESARLFTDLRPAPARYRVLSGALNRQRGAGRRQIVIVIVSRPRPRRKIKLLHLPDRQVNIRECRIGGSAHHVMGKLGHRPVMPVLPRHIQECGADDIRSLRADDFDKAFERAFAIPFFKCLGAAFRKTEIEDRVVGRFR